MKFKYSRLIQQKKRKSKIIFTIKNKTNKPKLENQTQARCQVRNKAMKTKLTNMLRGQERRKRKIDMQV